MDKIPSASTRFTDNSFAWAVTYLQHLMNPTTDRVYCHRPAALMPIVKIPDCHADIPIGSANIALNPCAKMSWW